MWDYEEIEWDKFPMKKRIRLEIINFSKVEAEERWRSKFANGYKSTFYYIFAAKSYDQIQSFCSPDDIVIFNVPAITFERALKGVALVKKSFIRSIGEFDNIYMEIEKLTNRNFIIHDIERKAEYVELTKEAGNLLYNNKHGGN